MNQVLALCRTAFAAETRRYRMRPEDREDLFEDVFLRVLAKLRANYEEDEARASLRTWVARQVQWGIADYWRGRYRRERRTGGVRSLDDPDLVAGPDDHPGVRIDSEEAQAAVRACLGSLTPTQRERLLAAEDLREAGSTQADLARRLGISLDSLKESLQRARALLRKCLEGKGFGPTSPPARGVPTE